jgi:DNA-binding transcriptional MerR regulator
MASLQIGDVAQRTGLTAPTIRYYESIGLLAAPARSASGYRRYSERTIDELLFVRKAQSLGFSLVEIAEILKLTREGHTPCARVLDLARHHLDLIDERIAQLTRFRTRLASEIGKWDTRRNATCTGLCEIIAGASDDVDPPPIPGTRM